MQLNNFVSFVIYFILGYICVFSQINIKLSIHKKQYLKYEAVELQIVLINNSGRSINFSKEAGSLYIDIKNHAKNKVDYIDGNLVNFADNLNMPGGITRTLTINLSKYFKLTRVDKYSVFATIRHKLFSGYDLQSKKPVIFQVINGISELKKEFGISKKKNGVETIEGRSYEIISYLRNDKRYMSIKIYDEKWIYSLLEIGVFIRGIPIQNNIDLFGNIHLLFHIGAKTFKYLTLSAKGIILQKRYFLATEEAYPILQHDKNTGAINILNATIAKEGRDYEAN